MFDWRARALDHRRRRYYKWTQWIFLQLYKQGLAYKKKAPVNWCPSLQDRARQRAGDRRRLRALRHRGRDSACWSSGSSGSPTTPSGCSTTSTRQIDWSETTVQAQRNWIGRSRGRRASRFRGRRRGESRSRVFTTRPDTLFGATYLVLAPEHPLVDALDHRRRSATRSRPTATQARRKDLVSRKVGDKEKTGVFTGAHAINPATGKRDPGLDRRLRADGLRHRRDHGGARARRARLRVRDEVRAADRARGRRPGRRCRRRRSTAAYADVDAGGRWSTPAQFDGLHAARRPRRRSPRGSQARGTGEAAVQYRLHDWCISRQRYWGPPIPIIYCDDCGPVPVPEDRAAGGAARRSRTSVPTTPASRRWRAHAEWYHVPCPTCGKQGRRETDVSRHLPRLGLVLPALSRAASSTDRAVRPELHAEVAAGRRATSAATSTRCCTCSTRASSRMVLHDVGLLDFEEPFRKFRAHGLIVEGRRQDVEVAAATWSIPDELHRPVGRRHLPHLPDVPRSLRGGRRLPRRRHHRARAASSTRSGSWSRWRATPTAATPRSGARC